MFQKKINSFYHIKKAIVLILAISVVISQFANPVIIFAETDAQPNPVFTKNCGLDIVLVLDNSTSINETDIQKEKAAFLELVDDLSGTPSEFSVVSFGTRAQPRQGFGGTISDVKTAINDIAYDISATNWQDALIASKNYLPNRSNKNNLIIFASDGNPTINNDDLNVYNSPINGNDWSYLDNNDRENAIIAANDVKQTYNTRIVALGIGSAVNEANLRKISGDAANDYYDVDNFDELKTALHDLAAEMCGGTITVNKFIGTEGNWQAAGAGWEFNIGNNPGKLTDALNGQTEAVELVNGNDYSVIETPQTGFVLKNASCIATNDGDTPVGTFDLSGKQVKEIQINTENVISCSFYNEVQCEKIYGDLVCDNNGIGHKPFTWSNVPLCSAAGNETVADASCDCAASEALRTCSSNGKALVNYRYNYSYCPADYQAEVIDNSCDSQYTCGDWVDGQCLRAGVMSQTRTCTDQYSNTNTETRENSGSFCACIKTETGRSCMRDSSADVNYLWSGQTYCTASFVEPVADSSCTCQYSDWTNSGCASDGKMGQIRNNQNTALTYCTDLTRQVDDISCAQCTAWSEWGQCSAACGGGTSTRTCIAGSLIGQIESAECNVQSCEGSTSVDGKWSDWSACSASCGGGTQVRVCTAPVNGGLECDQIDGGNATRACNAQACGGSSGGGIGGDFNKNYFNNPAGGQVAGAAIDLDAIQNEIDRIRDQVNGIAGQIAGLPKGILGAATAVNTGVFPVIAAGEDISIAVFPNKIEFTVPETASAAPSKSKQ